MKRLFAAAALSLIVLGSGATVAAADPSFGPGAGNGQGNNAPQDQGAKCHPPGQVDDRPECK
jgi:hypothetical protein